MNPATFEILPGLPSSGPLAEPFPPAGRMRFSEGLVVRFYPSAGEPWTGNFEPGYSTCTEVVQHPDSRRVVVVARGEGYVIEPENHQVTSDLIHNVTYVLNHRDMLVLGNDWEFEIIFPSDERWRSPRISWDGIRNIVVMGDELTAEAYSPVDDHWYPFTLDLVSRSVTGAIYPAQMANAIRITRED